MFIGRAWANKILERGICPPALCGFEHPTTLLIINEVILKTHKGIFMNNSSAKLLNGIYSLNPEFNQQQLYDAINRCLIKAEALAITATMADWGAFDDDIVTNYLWTLSDVIHEAKWLYEKIK